jgi:integrase
MAGRGSHDRSGHHTTDVGLARQAIHATEDRGRHTHGSLSGWLVEQLQEHFNRANPQPEHLLFATRTGQPMNPSNVRRDIWTKLVKRAGVRRLDLYSLRHTFASLGRTAGESAFNVARMMGHSRSTLVDLIYAHSLQSGMSSVAERVTARALGEQPKLRLVEGVSRDVRKPLEETPQRAAKKAASG